MEYTVTLVKDRTRQNNVEGLRAVREDQKRLTDEGTHLFGLFTPLFGLATNEFYVVTYAEAPHCIDDHLMRHNLEVLERQELRPTARPLTHEARSKPGIYVFRWFKVRPGDVDEIVRLSEQAWVTFEGGFDTEVQGLFRERESDGETGAMLLITQYTDLSVWEASRKPAPEAAENFRARAEITLEARPIATRLVI